jgi:transcription antitermination factor NusG
VFRLFTTDTHQPHPVPHGVVEALQATQDARRSVDAGRTAWAPGTACRLAAGAFAGHDAVVIGTRDGRTLVGVMCFGAMREVSVSSDCLMARE